MKDNDLEIQLADNLDFEFLNEIEIMNKIKIKNKLSLQIKVDK